MIPISRRSTPSVLCQLSLLFQYPISNPSIPLPFLSLSLFFLSLFSQRWIDRRWNGVITINIPAGKSSSRFFAAHNLACLPACLLDRETCSNGNQYAGRVCVCTRVWQTSDFASPPLVGNDLFADRRGEEGRLPNFSPEFSTNIETRRQFSRRFFSTFLRIEPYSNN